MKEFSGTKVPPPYAILSHTWGDDDDGLTFEDIEKQKPDATRKKGYAKMWDCCWRANADDYRWVWIDTCCIKKKSETELSEAIRSMYKWYRKSRICYVFLEDVFRDHDDWEEEFKEAR